MTAIPLQYLIRRRPEREGDRILVVQSGAARYAVQLVDVLRERHPGASITALVRSAELDAIPRREGVEYVSHAGANGALLRELLNREFDRVYVLLTDDPGYWKLKLLPLALRTGAVYAVNENLDWFAIDLEHGEALAQHVRGRLESSVTFAGQVRSPGVERVQKAVLYPAVLAYLLGYERAHQAVARLRGLVPWKRENRPGPAGTP